MKALGQWLRIVLAVATGANALAQTGIPEAEALQVPTPSRLALVAAEAGRRGWPSQAEFLHAAARRAYDDGTPVLRRLDLP